jgi:hypothetical protein
MEQVRDNTNWCEKDSCLNVFVMLKHIACNPETPSAALYMLSKLHSPGLLKRIAGNPNCPAELIAEIARHPLPEVRLAVCDNPFVPESVMVLLIEDTSADVRYALAENHNLSSEILERLSNDENPYVANRATRTLQRLNKSKGKKGQVFPWLAKQLTNGDQASNG